MTGTQSPCGLMLYAVLSANVDLQHAFVNDATKSMKHGTNAGSTLWISFALSEALNMRMCLSMNHQWTVRFNRCKT